MDLSCSETPGRGAVPPPGEFHRTGNMVTRGAAHTPALLPQGRGESSFAKHACTSWSFMSG
jgi:hypothetical protein